MSTLPTVTDSCILKPILTLFLQNILDERRNIHNTYITKYRWLLRIFCQWFRTLVKLSAHKNNLGKKCCTAHKLWQHLQLMVLCLLRQRAVLVTCARAVHASGVSPLDMHASAHSLHTCSGTHLTLWNWDYTATGIRKAVFRIKHFKRWPLTSKKNTIETFLAARSQSWSKSLLTRQLSHRRRQSNVRFERLEPKQGKNERKSSFFISESPLFESIPSN